MPTLKDIAERTGVTSTVVSHVLRNRLGHVRVGEKKRQEIIATARKMAYVPNLRARGLAAKKSFSLGFLMSWQKASHFSHQIYCFDLLQAVDQVCQKNGYHCLFASYPLSDPAGFSYPQFMRDGSVDGVILAGYTHKKVIERLVSLELPCVHVGSNMDPISGVTLVSVDLDAAFREVTIELYKIGHRRIQLILPEGPGPEKLAVNFHSLETKFDDIKLETVLLPSSKIAASNEALAHAQSLLKTSTRPTAYLCAHAYSESFVRVLHDNGLRCPRDFSIVVFGTQLAVEQPLIPCGPTASAIVTPTKDVGMIAAKQLLMQLGELELTQKPGEENILIPCQIIFGESSGPLN